MKTPLYFRQEKQATCSLAVLRMALHYFGAEATEAELLEKVEKDYGNTFSNIWNPTIAKLACEYDINTTLYALWPLLKKHNLSEALNDFIKNPQNFDVRKYENQNDKDAMPEPLLLAYKEMFLAVQNGCKTVYGGMTGKRMQAFLSKGHLIQTSVKLHLLYPGKNQAFHSILVYGLQDSTVYFHDPFHGEGLSCSVDRLLKASSDVGAFMVYKGRRQGEERK